MAWQAPFPRWLHNAKAANVELTVNRVSDGKGQEAILKSPTVPTVRCLSAFSTLNSIHSLTPVALFSISVVQPRARLDTFPTFQQPHTH